MRASEFVREVNAPGELVVDPDLIRRFTDRGWEIDGEGRDQLVMSRPGTNRVLKIVGQGTNTHIGEIRRAVQFFRDHQRNPHFPRVGQDRTFNWKGQPYYVYTQERLAPLSGDEEILDYLESVMGEIGHGEDPDYSQAPPGLTVEQVDGLVSAIYDMFDAGLLTLTNFDLGNVANIMQRANGQLVIVDPASYMQHVNEEWDDDDEDVVHMRLTDRLSYPEIVNRISSMMKAMGWRGKRKGDDDYIFLTRGQLEDEWYIVSIGKTTDGKGFTYALGTIEEGDPYIGQQDTMPNTVASVSMLADEIRDGFSLNESFADGHTPADAVLDYVKRKHHDFRMDREVLMYPRWQLTKIPLSNLIIADYTDSDIDLDQVDVVKRDPERKINQSPIVVDPAGAIIDGNHRAFAARELGMTHIPAWRPVDDLDENFADGRVKGKSRPGRVIDMLEQAGLEISSWLEGNPKLMESQAGWDEIQSLFKRISGDQPKLGQQYAVLNLVAVPPGRMLLQQGSAKSAVLTDIRDRGTYQQYEFDMDGDTIRYPEDHRAGDQLSRTFLFLNPRAMLKTQTFIELALKGWDIRNLVNENFADGKNPGRKGLSKRVGVSQKMSISKLEKIASTATGERRRMAQWNLNMKRGRQKNK